MYSRARADRILAAQASGSGSLRQAVHAKLRARKCACPEERQSERSVGCEMGWAECVFFALRRLLFVIVASFYLPSPTFAFSSPHRSYPPNMIARAAFRSALRATKAPSPLSQLGARRGYAEAVSEKLKLSFILPHEVRISPFHLHDTKTCRTRLPSSSPPPKSTTCTDGIRGSSRRIGR